MVVEYFLRHKNNLVLFFTLGYLLAFTLNAFAQGNWEFVYYIFMMTALIYTVVLINKNLHLAFFIILNLSLLGFLHLLGGNMSVANGIRLYDFYFVPNLIKYDNIIHFYGTFIATMVLYSLAAPYISREVRAHYPIFFTALILMAIGIGTLNELVEFFAVVFLDAAEEVGDYYNNSIDLLFNTIGSLMAASVIYFYREKPTLLALKRRHETISLNKKDL